MRLTSLRPARAPRAFLALLLGLFAASLFSACTSRSILRMDGRYEKARLPNHFDRDLDTNVRVFTVTTSKSQKEFVSWQDTSSQGAYTFSNAGYGVDLSLLVERGDVFLGGYLGASPEPGNLRLGGFLGGTHRADNIVGTMSVGLGFNLSPVTAHYVDTEWGLFSPWEPIEDSTSGAFASLEIPFRAGLLFDLGDLSPFVSMAFNLTAVGIEDEKQSLVSGEVGVGVEYRLTRSLTLRAEAVTANTAIEEHWTKLRHGGRFEFASAF